MQLKHLLIMAVASMCLLTLSSAALAQQHVMEEALPSVLRSTPEEMVVASQEENVLDFTRLTRLAADFARRHGDANTVGQVLGSTVLRDLDGRVVALAVVFPVGGNTPSARQLQTSIDGMTEEIIAMMRSNVEQKSFERVRDLGHPRHYLTVVVGAAATERRVLSMGPGLPLQVYAGVGRHKVAEAAVVGLQRVRPMRSFFEPLMPPGNQEGTLYSVPGKGEYVYFAPSIGSPTGHAGPLSTFQEARAQELDELTRDMATAAGYEGPVDAGTREHLQLQKNARSWGRHLKYLDLLDLENRSTERQQATNRAAASSSEAMCLACATPANDLLNLGIEDMLDFSFSGDSNCSDCTKIYLNGDRKSVASCNNMSSGCCEWEDGEFVDTGNCLDRCECNCTMEEWKTISYPVLLRGVPTLFQHDVAVNPVTIDAFGGTTTTCNSQAAVGCGPIALAELLIWYDAQGWDDILTDYRDASNDVEWRGLAEDLRNDYMGSLCWGSATWSLYGQIESGFEDFLADQGLSATVTHEKIRRVDEAVGWQTIQSEIDANRPLVLGYNHDGQESIASGWVDHYALIIGYSSYLGTNTIYVDTGWGVGSNRSYEWSIPANKVHLYTVEMGSTGSGGAEWCPAAGPNVNWYFAENDGVLDFSASEPQFDSYPVIEDLSGSIPPDCDRIGGTVEGWFNTSWTDVNRCLTPDEKERLDEVIAITAEEFGDPTEPRDELNPWPE